jgi:hypothetical protein
MPRAAAAASMDEFIRAALAPVIARASKTIALVVAQLAATRIEEELTKPRGRKAREGRARGRNEIARWVADRRARRVPLFVIEATGLSTKRQIVAKYGEDAAFDKGKPLPPVAAKSAIQSKPAVKAKPPIIRKNAKAAA